MLTLTVYLISGQRVGKGGGEFPKRKNFKILIKSVFVYVDSLWTLMIFSVYGHYHIRLYNLVTVPLETMSLSFKTSSFREDPSL